MPLERNEEFWQSAYQKYGASILAFLKVRVFDQADAEDLLQETFVRAIRASNSIVDLGKLKSFLFAIAHNLLVNRIRDQKSRSAAKPTDEAEAIPAQRPDASPEHASQMNAFHHRLSLALNDMPPNLRKAFELGVLQQEPYAEIARKTGWSAASVKINVYRARKYAVERLSGFLPF